MSRRRILATVGAAALVLTLNTGVAWATWSAGSVTGGSGAAAATTVDPGQTPSAVASGSDVTITWSASTLATGDAASGYRVNRYPATDPTAQTVLAGCAGVITTLTCTETGLPDGRWIYTITPLVGTFWTGAESAPSESVTTDSTLPTNAISLNVLSGSAVQDGTTIYYRGIVAGSFTLTNTLTDSMSGPASSTTTALAGATGGWTHSASTVSAPAGGPYVSTAFTWSDGTSSAPTETVTGRDASGNSDTTTLSFVNDSDPPVGTTVSYPDGYQADESVPVSFTDGTDAAGIAARQLQRSAAGLTDGTCGSFSGFSDIGPNDPASPYSDTAATNGHCYTYRYVVTDRLGNVGIATSSNVAKLDPYVGGPDLGAAGPYSVLAGTEVTNDGSTVVNGNLGISPGQSLIGFPPGTVNGDVDLGDVAAPAQAALTSAYADAAGRDSTGTFAGDQNGQTFGPGVYRTGSAFELTGTMVLDGRGDPNALFIFQVNGALGTGMGSHVELINGAQAAHVYWQVDGAASTGAASSFVGTIMTIGAITLGSGMQLTGRALSPTAVTLDTNTV